MNLSEATEAYQALLEGHRAHPDDEGIYAQMLEAKAYMEVRWMEQLHAQQAA
jgi:hypothetical protein